MNMTRLEGGAISWKVVSDQKGAVATVHIKGFHAQDYKRSEPSICESWYDNIPLL